MDLKEIQNLIKFVAKSGTSEVKLEMDDFKITIKTGSGESVTTVVQQAGSSMLQAAPSLAPQEVVPDLESSVETKELKAIADSYYKS